MQTAWGVLAAVGAIPVGTEAMEMFRISRGIPRYGADIRERDLPQETGQTRALSFTKGCYLGQEIVERIRSRGAVHREFTAFEVEGRCRRPARRYWRAKKKLARLRAARSCRWPREVGRSRLGYLRREASGKTLRAGGATLKPASLPITRR